MLGCTDQHMSPQYEPLFLNETNSNVLFIYSSFSDSKKNLDTLRIAPSDTIYSIPGEKFPWLDEKGLNQGNGSLYDIRIVFEKKPKRCLNFEGTEMKTNDIRNFSSYENIGKLDKENKHIILGLTITIVLVISFTALSISSSLIYFLL